VNLAVTTLISDFGFDFALRAREGRWIRFGPVFGPVLLMQTHQHACGHALQRVAARVASMGQEMHFFAAELYLLENEPCAGWQRLLRTHRPLLFGWPMAARWDTAGVPRAQRPPRQGASADRDLVGVGCDGD
jgi:hypothetical protein